MNFLSPLTQRLYPILKGMWFTFGPRANTDPTVHPVLFLLYSRLARIAPRLDSLIRRWQAGLLRPARPRLTPRKPAPQATTPQVRLPQGYRWLNKLVPMAPYTGQFASFLEDPEVQALVAAAPQAGRLFRPLCHALGIEPPPYLRLPKRIRKPRKPRPPIPRKPRQTPARGFTRTQIDRMTAAQLTAHYGRLPPHANLPIPNLNHIRRKIAAG